MGGGHRGGCGHSPGGVGKREARVGLRQRMEAEGCQEGWWEATEHGENGQGSGVNCLDPGVASGRCPLSEWLRDAPSLIETGGIAKPG